MLITFVVLITTLGTSVSAAKVTYPWNTSSLPYFKGYGTVKAQHLTQFSVSGYDYYGFCIAPNKTFNGSTNLDGFNEYDFDDYSDLTSSQKTFINLCTYYGYPNANTNDSYYYATQMLIWEIVGGYRTCDTSDSSSFASNSVNFVKKTSYWSRVGLTESSVLSAYNTIVKKVSRQYTKPENILDSSDDSILYSSSSSANSNAYELVYNFTNKRYQVTFKVPKDYVNSSNSYAYSNLASDIENNQYLSVDVDTTSSSSYNIYTVYTKAEFSGTATISTSQQVVAKSKSDAKYLEKSSNIQEIYTGTETPSAKTAYISFKTPDNPNVEVYKQFNNYAGTNLGTSESAIADYCDDCKFIVTKTIDGTTNYVKFTKGSNGQWSFNGFTETKADATTITLTVKQKSGKYYGYFALIDLPSFTNKTADYKVLAYKKLTFFKIYL